MTRDLAAQLAKEAKNPATREALEKAAKKPSNDNRTHSQLPDAKSLKRPAALAGGNEAQARSAGRIALRFTLRRVRLLDPCAKYGSCKALIDGLRYAGILHNDREEDITLEVQQEKVAHYNEEKTLIRIDIPTTPK